MFKDFFCSTRKFLEQKLKMQNFKFINKDQILEFNESMKLVLKILKIEVTKSINSIVLKMVYSSEDQNFLDDFCIQRC